MVTNYEYALFSLDAYQDASDNVTLPSNWSVYKTSDDFGHSNGGYFGIAYINNTTNEVVISHRGTELSDLGDLFNDAQIGLGFVPSQYTNGAKPFEQSLQNELAGYQITHTGHSLGGVLAEISAYQTQTSAVTFDSAGTKPLIENLIDGNISTPYADITTFNSAPNFVNSTNDHIGNIHRIFPEFDIQGTFNDETSYGTFLLDYTADNQHSMVNILNSFNPQTGDAYISSMVSNSLWPTGTGSSGAYQSFFLSYDRNPHYWEECFTSENITGQAKINFINSNLGGISDNIVTGMNIKGDISDNYIWGTTNGKDVVAASGGQDFVLSYGGDDFIFGGTGYDVLVGASGSDNIFGGFGNDILIGGFHADKLTGGWGSDSFKFNTIFDSNSTYGVDTIQDFQDGVDFINLANLQSSGIDEISDLTITNDGVNTTISANTNDFEIELAGVIALDNSDFIWA